MVLSGWFVFLKTRKRSSGTLGYVLLPTAADPGIGRLVKYNTVSETGWP